MKNRKVFITGIAGFAGSYLSELLLDKGYVIYGLLAPGEKTTNISHIKNELSLDRFDILKQVRLEAAIKKINPNYIFHLAALSSVGQSFENEKKVYDTNFGGTLSVISAILKMRIPARLVYVSSSDVYGQFSPKNKTLTESQPFNPLSPYAISKASGEYLVQYHIKRSKLPAVIARPFNHTGPRQSEHFVVPSFCRQVAMIEASKKKGTIKVGDLSARRDLSDVRDIVRGYYLLSQKGKPGEVYQLCSGKSVAIKADLNKVISLSSADIKVQIDKNKFRKTDIPTLRGNNRQAVEKMGWRAEYKLDKTIKDTLDYWRDRINYNKA